MGKEARTVSLPLVSVGGVQIRQLLPEAEFLGNPEVLVHRCVTNPQQVRPGDVWVAVPPLGQQGASRQKTPGRNEANSVAAKETDRAISPAAVAKAVAGRATAIVTEHPFPGLPLLQAVVPDAREALGRICHALAGHPSKALKVIAVSGMLGTTPTGWLLRRILAEAGYRTGLLSSLGVFDGTTWTACEPTSGPEILAGQLAQMVAQKCTHAVIEVHFRALAERSLAGIELDGVCLTPFGCLGPASDGLECPARGDQVLSIETLEKTKFLRQKGRMPKESVSDPCPGRHAPKPKKTAGIPACQPEPTFGYLQTVLFRYLPAEGLTVLSADDPVSAGCLPFLDGPVLTVGTHRMAEITAQMLEQQLAEQTFLLQAGTDVVPVCTRRIGQEHMLDCLLAATMGLAYGIDLVPVIRALESVETVPGHLERIERGQPFSVFVDFARSALACQETLRTLRSLCQGRLLCVVGVGPRQGKKLAALSRLLPHYGDKVFLTLEHPTEKPLRGKGPDFVQPILNRFQAPKQALWIADRGEAIYTALQQAQPGDCVAILSKPPKSFVLSSNATAIWDDREVVHFCLEMLDPGEFSGMG